MGGAEEGGSKEALLLNFMFLFLKSKAKHQAHVKVEQNGLFFKRK